MSRPAVIYSLPRVEYSTLPCVYKLSFEDKYLIIKAKDHQASVMAIQKSLNQFVRGSEFQRNPENIYFHFFSFVDKKKEGIFQVDILIESENAYELLKIEQSELEKNRKDKKCLNGNMDAYLPAYNEVTGKYGWIAKSAFMSFKKWLKNR